MLGRRRSVARACGVDVGGFCDGGRGGLVDAFGGLGVDHDGPLGGGLGSVGGVVGIAGVGRRCGGRGGREGRGGLRLSSVSVHGPWL